MLGFNCAASLTSKRSTNVKDIKPVSPDAVGQACEVKGRRGEKCYTTIVPSRYITHISRKSKAAH